MRAILDTNVLISALFFGGVPLSITDAVADGKLHLVISPSIISEYCDVAERISKKRPTDYKLTMEWLITHSELIPDSPLPSAVSADPDDDKFIAAALESGAMIICSGDKHLLDIDGYKGIEVLKPKPFYDKYLK